MLPKQDKGRTVAVVDIREPLETIQRGWRLALHAERNKVWANFRFANRVMLFVGRGDTVEFFQAPPTELDEYTSQLTQHQGCEPKVENGLVGFSVSQQKVVGFGRFFRRNRKKTKPKPNISRSVSPRNKPNGQHFDGFGVHWLA